MHDAAIGECKRQLAYKTEWYDVAAVQCPRDYPSSQLCWTCGWQFTALKLSQKHWTCRRCGTKHHRDDNAAANVAEYAIATWRSQGKTILPKRTHGLFEISAKRWTGSRVANQAPGEEGPAGPNVQQGLFRDGTESYVNAAGSGSRCRFDERGQPGPLQCISARIRFVPYGPRVDVKEHRKLRDPLFEERSQVHQHERVPGPFGNHANPRHRLAHARRRDEHSDVMGPECAHCVLLKLRRHPVESMHDGVSILSLVINLQRRAQGLEQRGRVVDTPPGQRDMPGEVLRTADDARDACSGEPQLLLLVEVGILEGGDAPERVDER